MYERRFLSYLAGQAASAVETMRFHIKHPDLIKAKIEPLILYINPFAATRSQLEERHKNDWTGIKLTQMLTDKGFNQSQIEQLATQANKDFDRFELVGTVYDHRSDEMEPILVEMDGNDGTRAKYYIGIEAIMKNKFFEFEQLVARLN